MTREDKIRIEYIRGHIEEISKINNMQENGLNMF